MGLCLSKKKTKDANSPPPPLPPPVSNEEKVEKKKAIKTVVASKLTAGVAVTSSKKKPVFAIAQTTKTAVLAPEEKEKKKAETPTNGNDGGVAMVEEMLHAPFRASSCTKEEVDAILIQCGRLSHSSSGREGGGGHRRRSSSKRSFDFDNEKKGEEEDGEKPLSRPSPHRRTPSRERVMEREHNKHSRSRERGSGGGRRTSRSPARRPDGQVLSERPKQPVKMVSVPAREKGSCSRRASPRSQSPSNTCRILDENSLHCPRQLLGQSSPRKAARSPYRRNPMAEIDENILRGNQIGRGSNNYKVQKAKDAKLNQSQAQKERQNIVDIEQQVNCKAKKEEKECEIVEDAKGSLNPSTVTRTRSLRRSSRDFDQNLGLNQDATLGKNSFTSLMLEEIQNYQKDDKPVAFTLPACLSKACSILEAVADLNSSSSDKKSFEFNPKNVTVGDKGGETAESQESWGSNGYLGQEWSSSWEPSSIESVDHRQTSRSNNNGKEGEGKKRGFDHQCQLHVGNGGGGGGSGSGGIGSGNSGGRALSLPVLAAAGGGALV
ncbi:uncharacterized protein At1g65710-like [Typha latifolia]|uniref:uncharacterized protein At1g65710-like n=1 Tax=Typha latifolia TaxID=4733 RepID=UPI003C2BB1BF